MALKVPPKPDVPVVNPPAGVMTKEWYDFFNPPPPPLPSPRDLRVYAQPAAGKVVLLEDYGLKGDYLTNGGFSGIWTNNVVAWNTVMANATRGDIFVLPCGLNGQSYTAFNSKPNPLPDETQLVGNGRVTSALVRAYSPGLNTFDPFLEFGAHTTMRDFVVFAGFTTHGGFAIARTATNANDAAQDTTIENCFVSGFGGVSDSDWTSGLVIDSILGAPAFGSRSINVVGLQINRYTGFGMKIAAVNSGTFTGLGFAAQSPFFNVSSLDVWLSGSASNTNNLLNITGANIGRIFIERTNASIVTAAAVENVILGATSNSVMVVTGVVSGLITNSGTSCRVVSSAGANPNTWPLI